MKPCAFAARAAASICSSVYLAPRAVGDVGAHGVVEQHRVLAHDAGERAQRRERDVARVDAVEQDAAGRRLVEARDEVDERALPRPARADQRDDVALARREARCPRSTGVRVVREGRHRRTRATRRSSSPCACRGRAASPSAGRAPRTAARRRERLLRRRRHLRELLERRQQAHHERHERDEATPASCRRPSTHFARRSRGSARDGGAEHLGDRLAESANCAMRTRPCEYRWLAPMKRESS